jgi:protein-tyrosine-phosphatase
MATMTILVLCTGNIGRSPLAEILLKEALSSGLGVLPSDLAAAGVVVTSAGTQAPEGQPASLRGIVLAADRGLDLSKHHATHLTWRAVLGADRIFVMDNEQLEVVRAMAPQAAAKTELLAGEGNEIADPHHESDEFFRDVFIQIEEAVAKRATELLSAIAPDSVP